MIHFIYQTTNLVNNKRYIGKHTGEFDDSYLGSGFALKRALKKYGKKNFKREILCLADDENSLNELEKLYITEDIVANNSYYNLKLGGDGARKGEYAGSKHPLFGTTGGMYGKKHSDKTKQLMSINNGRPWLGKKFSEVRIEKMRQVSKNRVVTDKARQNYSAASKKNTTACSECGIIIHVGSPLARHLSKHRREVQSN